MGAIFNAQANHSPLVITAGQQSALADHHAGQPDQPRRDPDAAPAGQVELRAGPRRGRAPGARPGHAPGDAAAEGADVRLDPDGRLGRRGRRRGRPGGDRRAGPAAGRSATRRPSPSSRGGWRRPRNPVLVAGPDIDASGGWEAAIALAERQRLPVFATPAPGGGRIGFPEGHPNFRGVLPPAIGPVSETLAGRDLILVVGSSVFPVLPEHPRPAAARGRDAGRRSPPTPTRPRGRRWATRSSAT